MEFQGTRSSRIQWIGLASNVKFQHYLPKTALRYIYKGIPLPVGVCTVIPAILRKGRNDEEASPFYIGRASVRVFSIHTGLDPGKTALNI